MLKRIVLDNFKAFDTAEVDFGLITVLIGPNGTGKSSIGQALMLLRQSLGAEQLQTSGELIDLGDFKNVVNRSSSREQIGLQVSCNTTADYPTIGILKDALFTYGAHFSPSVTDYEGTIGTPREKELFTEVVWGVMTVARPQSLQLPLKGDVQGSLHFGSSRAIAKPFTVTGFTGGDSPTVKTAQNEANALLATVERILHHTYYVPAIRGLEHPDYPLLDSYIIDIQPGKNAQLASTFAYAGRDLEEKVSIWSEEITGSAIGVEVIPGKRVTVDSEAARGGIPVICDGFGTNQLVHLLLILAGTRAESVIAIEEPEIHLHPRAQNKLSNIIVQEAKTSRKQVIVTTHSERILNGFIRAVKEGTLQRDDLAIYHFAEKGHAQRVEQDEGGDIYVGWGNFFSVP